MKQIIRLSWNNWKPELVLTESSIPLEGEINLKLGQKYCIGYYTNKQNPCPSFVRLLFGKQCAGCREHDLYANCARCDGSNCINVKRRKECIKSENFIYLAAFHDLLKVGVSSKYRFKKRFIEQGADFAAKIMKVDDGRIARLVEQQVSKKLGITDRVWGRTKGRLLFPDPNVSVALIKNAYEKLKGKFNLLDFELYDLRSYYNLDALNREPKWLKIREGTRIAGEILAVKGNITVLKTNEDIYAFNVNKLIGRLVE